MPKLTVVSLTDVLRPTASTALRRWKADMSWVFKEPYRVAVGRSYPEQDNDVCPVWGDRVPWKSVTVVVPADEEGDAAYCLAMAHGGEFSRRKVLADGRVALRSDYQAW